MTDEEFQHIYDEGVKLVLQTIEHHPWPIRLTILTSALAASAHANNVPQTIVIAALNYVFKDIEAGEIPGKEP